MDITSRTVFIAGATSGIGLELARRFATVGSTVIAGGRRTDLLDEIAGEGFSTVQIDVTDQAGVEVSELIPPAVATTPEHAQRNPRALGLADFATEVMDLLQTDPPPHEILVKGVLMHRWAERDGTYDELVAQRSQALAMLPGRQ
jgi:short-subunit dehydrogenase involved in D-alanine esterification of teichoic acids